MNLIFKHENCSGCGVCKLACSIVNFRQVTSSMALLRIEGLFPEPGIYHIHVCNQCGLCADVCPVEAIVPDKNGIYRIKDEECILCHECVEACPDSVMIIKPENKIPAKCILCGECASVCPRGAIIISQEENAG